MKEKLIALLKELLEENDKIKQKGLKIDIMVNTAFLSSPRNFPEVTNIMNKVNSFIDNTNEASKVGIASVIERIEGIK